MNMMDIGARVMEVLVDVQTELICFCLAFATHILFTRGLSLRRPASKGKDGAFAAPAAPQKPGQKGAATVASLRAALRAGDVQAVLGLLEALRGLWQEGGRASPSSAPRALMEQAARLAVRQGALSELLQVLAKNALLDSAFDFVLAECVEQGDACAVKKAEQLGRAHSMKFSAAAYQSLIKAASNSGTQADVKELMSEAQESGSADAGTYVAYMSASLKLGNSSEVWTSMKNMKTAGVRPSAIAFNKLLGVAISSDVGAVWGIVDQMRSLGVKPDQTTCAILLKSRCLSSKNANLEKVVEMLDELDVDVDEVLFCSVVDACVRVGRADLLMPFLKKQKRVAVKTHTFASIIRAYGYVHDVKGVWDTWHEMRKRHVAPISVTLGCMVEALVTNGDIDGGYELIQEMREDEGTASLVNAVMYGSIVKGFSHKKNFGRMWDVYDEMVAQKLEFSMVTYNTLIDACARSGDLSRIPSLLKDIEAQGLQIGLVTYSAILKGYCQKNLLDEAFELFDDMKRNTKFEPDEIMYNSLLDGCARQGLYDRGMDVLERMEQSGVRPSNYTLSVLVKMANRSKKLERAFEFCDELSAKYSFRLNVHVFANLIQACINHHDLQRAIGVLERMVQERVRPDVRTYSLLLKACIQSKEPKDADGLLRSALGLTDPHPLLAKYPAPLLKLPGGLPGDLVSEVLQGLMDFCREERLAAALFLQISKLPGVQLDSKLRLRLTARMSEWRR